MVAGGHGCGSHPSLSQRERESEGGQANLSDVCRRPMKTLHELPGSFE